MSDKDELSKLLVELDKDNSHEIESKKANTSFKIPSMKLPPSALDKNMANITNNENQTVPNIKLKNGENLQSDFINKKDTMITANINKNKLPPKKQTFSPAELLNETQTVLPYKEPTWSELSSKEYYLEAIKNGSIVDKLDLSQKPFYIVGRLPSCDHPMDHPSLSRYHAVLQYGNHLRIKNDGLKTITILRTEIRTESINESKNDLDDVVNKVEFAGTEDDYSSKGWYVYDLDSTHGTWVNKVRIVPMNYVRIRVGHVLKFGGSSRIYVLHGPSEDIEAESQLTITELKAQREKQKRELELIGNMKALEAKERERMSNMGGKEDEGCTWGMGEGFYSSDNDDDTVDGDNPFAILEDTSNEHLYINDPKKSLRGFFEREGLDLPEYIFTDDGLGRYKCRLELPIDTPSGESIFAEVLGDGRKKKDSVIACALESCKILDRHGLLRQSHHESRSKKRKNWEEADYYDSDDDTFLDRTGKIEEKRVKRMERITKGSNIQNKPSETFESIKKKLDETISEMNSLEEQLKEDNAKRTEMEEDSLLDALDAFMMSIKSGCLDTKTRTTIKQRLVVLKQQRLQLDKLYQVAKPYEIKINKPISVDENLLSIKDKEAFKNESKGFKLNDKLPLFGKINKNISTIKSLVPKRMAKDGNSKNSENESEEDEVLEDVLEQVNEVEEINIGYNLNKKKKLLTPSSNVKPLNNSFNDSKNDIFNILPNVKSLNNSSNEPIKLLSKESISEVNGKELSPERMRDEVIGDNDKLTHIMMIDEVVKNNNKLPHKMMIDEEIVNNNKFEEDIQSTTELKLSSQKTLTNETLSSSKSHVKKSSNYETNASIFKNLTNNSAGNLKCASLKNMEYIGPDYQTWLPPQNQSGDGKTRLNEKLGY